MCHVLIIEDEALIAMLIRDVLEDAGATSFSFAATQDEAVAAAVDRIPAIITSDVNLLTGTGPQAVAVIQQQLGPVPVVFITATPADCDPCPDTSHILSKPFSADAVTKLFHDLVPHN
ncbi:response regulator [Sphingobium yanoikuyae]|uniref:response regulator n=1 Tax=Sphingobium yanoikuyae TaxID=13690 RepID=UPI00056CF4B6|nr:response regulator [Sphingobium yanoikuyae]